MVSLILLQHRLAEDQLTSDRSVAAQNSVLLHNRHTTECSRLTSPQIHQIHRAGIKAGLDPITVLARPRFSVNHDQGQALQLRFAFVIPLGLLLLPIFSRHPTLPVLSYFRMTRTV